jgi:hypothetical protein
VAATDPELAAAAETDSKVLPGDGAALSREDNRGEHSDAEYDNDLRVVRFFSAAGELVTSICSWSSLCDRCGGGGTTRWYL